MFIVARTLYSKLENGKLLPTIIVRARDRKDSDELVNSHIWIKITITLSNQACLKFNRV